MVLEMFEDVDSSCPSARVSQALLSTLKPKVVDTPAPEDERREVLQCLLNNRIQNGWVRRLTLGHDSKYLMRSGVWIRNQSTRNNLK